MNCDRAVKSVIFTMFVVGLWVAAAGSAHAARKKPGVTVGKIYRVDYSTAYCPGSAGSVMANGRRVRFGAVANNFLPLGTRIRMIRPRKVFGKRIFRVEDRIGHSSQLDFWLPSCSQAFAWGRRSVSFKVLG